MLTTLTLVLIFKKLKQMNLKTALNPHSKLALFYRYFYLRTNLPKSLCDYSWSLVLAIICFPFVWSAMLVNHYKNAISLSTNWVWKTSDYVDEQGYTHKNTARKVEETKYFVDFNPLPTFVGVIISFGLIILGFIVSALGVTVFGLISLMPPNPNWMIAFQFYFMGIFACISGIVLFFIFGFLIRLLPKKKPLTYAEQEAKELKDQEYFNAMSEKRAKTYLYRQANPRITTLIWRGLVAFKDKNCPMITWDY